MNNATIQSRGSNQYSVTIGNSTKIIDLDGMDVVSTDDYIRMEDAGMDMDDYIHPNIDNDPHWHAATKYAVEYSGIDVDERIASCGTEK